MKNILLILFLFSLIGVKCRKDTDICIRDTDDAGVDVTLFDANTRKDYFGGIGVNKVLPNEISMYEENFQPFLLAKSANFAGYPWNTRYINDGYVSNSIQIPYVEGIAFTRDSVGKQINRTYYLKIKQDVDTIQINYFMKDYCTRENLNMEIYYNGIVYFKGSTRDYQVIKVYKK